jgi:hypothetical protein
MISQADAQWQEFDRLGGQAVRKHLTNADPKAVRERCETGRGQNVKAPVKRHKSKRD